MNRDAVFDLREHAVERVSRVWNVKLGIPLMGEQTTAIVFERAICRPQSLVRIFPSALCVRRRASFI